jgi:hypothetical protein
LLRNDVLRTHVFWREGWAELKFSYKPVLQSDPPPESTWQVGFLFWIEIEAGAAGRIFTEPLP